MNNEERLVRLVHCVPKLVAYCFKHA